MDLPSREGKKTPDFLSVLDKVCNAPVYMIACVHACACVREYMYVNVCVCECVCANVCV